MNIHFFHYTRMEGKIEKISQNVDFQLIGLNDNCFSLRILSQKINVQYVVGKLVKKIKLRINTYKINLQNFIFKAYQSYFF